MAIGSVSFENFTAFRKVSIDLSPGINVFIGENGTGKTHAMKALYAAVRAGADPLNASIYEKLVRVFRPDGGIGARLAHRRPGQSIVRLEVVDDKEGISALKIATKRSTASETLSPNEPPPAVFLPSREGLAMYEGFIASYQKRELAFDETYFDLAVSLSTAALRGKPPKALTEVVEELERAVGGKVVLDGPRFYLRGEGGSMLEAPLLSEGFRKLASVLRLIQNGELRETGLLLWDEPEANLNPRLTVIVARALAQLARNNVQVIISTHDYLLMETLALFARQPKAPITRFFVFERKTGESGVTVSGAERLDDLPSNPIRQEFLALPGSPKAFEESRIPLQSTSFSGSMTTRSCSSKSKTRAAIGSRTATVTLQGR